MTAVSASQGRSWTPGVRYGSFDGDQIYQTSPPSQTIFVKPIIFGGIHRFLWNQVFLKIGDPLHPGFLMKHDQFDPIWMIKWAPLQGVPPGKNATSRPLRAQAIYPYPIKELLLGGSKQHPCGIYWRLKTPQCLLIDTSATNAILNTLLNTAGYLVSVYTMYCNVVLQMNVFCILLLFFVCRRWYGMSRRRQAPRHFVEPNILLRSIEIHILLFLPMVSPVSLQNKEVQQPVKAVMQHWHMAVRQGQLGNLARRDVLILGCLDF